MKYWKKKLVKVCDGPLIICIFLIPELMQRGASWCVQNIISNNSEINTLIEVETESKLANTCKYSPIETIKLIIITVESISL